jgi:glutathione synthase/RimK-type ligase-like ATP-grasp enzyme
MARVAVLRCGALPSFVTWEIPDVEALFDDDRLLIDALGPGAEPVVWSDPDVDWDAFDIAVIRSTWDYIDHGRTFGEALARIESSSCVLANPAAAVAWNTDKHYLVDLHDRGVPVVPTVIASTATPSELQDAALEQGWTGAVVKPRVGVGGAHVERIAVHDIAATLEGKALNEFLLQPLAESVLTEGELSFIFIAGRVSHALLKRPAEGDFRAHGIYGGTVELIEPAPSDVAEAEAILAAVGFDLLYARLDAVRIDGRLAVMELELIEPMLYLGLAPGSAERLAAAVLQLSERRV